MTKQNWLQDFKSKLNNGNVIYNPTLKPIAYYEPKVDNSEYSLHIPIFHFKDDKQIHATEDITIDVLDLDKHLKQTKQPYLETVLMNRKYIDKTLIVDNEILDKYQLGYHVVYLDGSVDLATHFYDQVPVFGDVFNKDYQHLILENLAGCLIFLNPDNSYFCAIPCLQSNDVDHDAYDHINVTLQQIQEVLEPVPLMRIGKIYTFFMIFTYDLNLSYSQTEQFRQYFKSIKKPIAMLTYAGRSKSTHYLDQYKLISQYCTMKAKSENVNLGKSQVYEQILNHLAIYQEKNMVNCLQKHSDFFITDTGEFKVKFDISLPNVTKVINEHLNQHFHHVHHWSEDSTNIVNHRAYQIVAVKGYTQKFINSDYSISLHVADLAKVTSTDIELPDDLSQSKDAAMKPIMHNNGVTDALLSLSGSKQKFYYQNHRLITIHRIMPNVGFTFGKNMTMEGIVGRI